MAGARGDALEWALALVQAPMERYALRQRRLPDGIETLLQIAAHPSGAAVAEAVALTGQSAEHILEAVRFYLREVLFFPQADAYRVLGLERDADGERIKSHHRLLQQWLHPDRHASDEDAAFAGRVNAAWNALRSESRRATYGEAHPHPMRGVQESPPLGAVRVHAPDAPPVPHGRWRGRMPVLMLFAACLALGLFALREQLREPHVQFEAASVAAEAEAEGQGDLPLAELQAPVSRTARRAAPGPASPARAARRVQAPVPMATPVVAAAPAPIVAGPARPAPAPVSRHAPALPVPVLAASHAAINPVPADDLAPPPAPPVRNTEPATLAASPPPRVDAKPLPPRPPAQPPAQPPADQVVPAERVDQAQQTGAKLLAYLSGKEKRLPAIWDNLGVQQVVMQLREDLRARGQVRLMQPRWRVARSDAEMRAELHDAEGHAGRLTARLVWREQRWLVRGMTMERDW